MTERRIDYVLLSEVQPALRNPRLHSNLEDVKQSIRTSGFVESAVHDGRTGRIIAGHGRLEALQAMEAADEDVPDGIEKRDGRWVMPLTVGWSSRDDAEAERMVVWLNRAPETGGWDDQQLAALLTDLRATDDGLVGSGYSSDDLDALLAELMPPNFQPQNGDGQPRLDVRNPTICPQCGFSFHKT